MKKLIALVSCLVLVLSLTVFVSADCNEADTTNYIGSLCGISYRPGWEYADALKKADIPSNKYSIVGGSASTGTDFNKGCLVVNSSYIRLLRENTNDSSNAIRGLIAVYKTPQNAAGDTTITVNDIVYTAVPGYYVYDKGYSGSVSDHFDAFSFNEGINSGKCDTEVYLYYTKDPKAGEPITDLTILNGSSHENDAGLVKTVDGVSCDFNKGAGGAYIYLQIVRYGGAIGSVFADTSNVFVIAAGAVVILVAIGFVIFKKRKGEAK